MTGYESKRAAARDKLAQPAQEPVGRFAKFTDGIWREVTEGSAGAPLYTTPPAQEPVAWGVDWGKVGDIPCVSIIKRLPNGGIEVVSVEYALTSSIDADVANAYTPQRPWVGLTDEDIALIDWESLVTKKDCVRTIEAKLKEKNT